jgi:hypothetical protein
MAPMTPAIPPPKRFSALPADDSPDVSPAVDAEIETAILPMVAM